MANKTQRPHSPKPVRQQARYDPQRGSRPPEMVDLVDPAWILKAVGGVFVVALLCAYVTLSLLFWHSQWQLVLHPSRVVASTPAAVHLPFQEVHFDVDSTGQPQIDGWWIPAGADASANAATALVLHAGDGSMSDALPAAEMLHHAKLNVLLFDYRGFGRSAGQHPTEATMQADAGAALNYLTSTRGVPVPSIVLYGTGAGSALAVQLAMRNPSLPAVVLQSPDGDYAARAKHDPRAALVPFGLLFNQNFALAGPLHRLKTPVLTISNSDGQAAVHEAVEQFIHEYVGAHGAASP